MTSGGSCKAALKRPVTKTSFGRKTRSVEPHTTDRQELTTTKRQMTAITWRRVRAAAAAVSCTYGISGREEEKKTRCFLAVLLGRRTAVHSSRVRRARVEHVYEMNRSDKPRARKHTER